MKYLMYHRICLDEDDIRSDYDITEKQFLNHIQIVKNLSKSVTFTFDDGNKSDLWAGQQLKNSGMKAKFFVTVDWIDQPGYLETSDLILLQNMGHEICSHSLSHPMFDRLTSDLCDYELMHSKRKLEKLIGQPVKSFAFPGGKYKRRSVIAANKAGYKFVFSSKELPWKSALVSRMHVRQSNQIFFESMIKTFNLYILIRILRTYLVLILRNIRLN